jgi:TRAP-type mannitol/chloroaromatic compound transport system permease large subunit
MEILQPIIVTGLIFSPVIVSLGYDLTRLGILIVLLGQRGMISPSVGINVFSSPGPDLGLGTAFRGSTPHASVRSPPSGKHQLMEKDRTVRSLRWAWS